jgi:hypothetical protein
MAIIFSFLMFNIINFQQKPSKLHINFGISTISSNKINNFNLQRIIILWIHCSTYYIIK